MDGILAREPNNVEALLLLATLFDHDKDLFEAGNVFRKVIDINGKESPGLPGPGAGAGPAGPGRTRPSGCCCRRWSSSPTSVKNRLAVFSFYVSQRKFDKAEARDPAGRGRATPARCDLLDHAGQLLPGHAENRGGRGRLPQGGRGGARRARSPTWCWPASTAAIGQKDKSLAMYRQARGARAGERQHRAAPSPGFTWRRATSQRPRRRTPLVLQKRPKYFPARMLQSELLIAKRDFGPAVELLNQLIQEEPKSAPGPLLQGAGALRPGGCPPGPGRRWPSRSSSKPATLRAHLLLAEIYLQERDADRARREVEAALKIDPQNYQAQMMLGNIYLGQQKYAEAQAAYDAPRAGRAEQPGRVFPAGRAAAGAQAVRPGARELRQGARHQSRTCWMSSAASSRSTPSRRSIDQGLRALRPAAAAGGGTPAAAGVIHNLKGGLYLAKGDAAAAEGSFRTAIQKNPNLLAPYYALAGIYLQGPEGGPGHRAVQAAAGGQPEAGRPAHDDRGDLRFPEEARPLREALPRLPGDRPQVRPGGQQPGLHPGRGRPRPERGPEIRPGRQGGPARGAQRDGHPRAGSTTRRGSTTRPSPSSRRAWPRRRRTRR
ncbi:MAG: tetratricopeptide repeat protein [Desulfobacterales bacterium]|nr:tetratricopeptide repeat protein [Desulfobacterales bacterium]